MSIFDMPLAEMRHYRPELEEPTDFDAFWEETLAESRAYPLDARFERADYGLQTVESFDVTFAGYGGQLIKGWFLLPRQSREPLPTVVEFLGYGGGRSFPIDWLLWPSVGFAFLVMDTRGQGSAWQSGDTSDLAPTGSNPHYPGFMTQGVLDPHNYYYRRLFTDAIRAVEAARSHPRVDARHIALTGRSQGGGISLAVGALDPTVHAVMPDVPFLCHFRRATEITDTIPYREIAHYCKIHRDQVPRVFRTLSYFDGVNFARRSHARALFSVALMDTICPPSTVFAAYNHYAGPKEINIWHYNDHEGGGSFQAIEKVRFLRELWG